MAVGCGGTRQREGSRPGWEGMRFHYVLRTVQN